ncbi:MAG: DegT/DnrJ/EryC1/StrS family aminotransferase [Spirochaetia bacterium]|nr:DegT/DnrJ/EryC1/StrS family aminotransferase [Spirochaetia bacterium]
MNRTAKTDFRIGWSGRAHDYTQEELDLVCDVMRTADPLTQGRYLAQFEKDFADYIESQHCFGVTNATHALELIVDLARLQPGDEVIIPGHTYCASAIPFGRAGVRIRWADIDHDNFEISLESIRKCLSPKTKAIVVVHLYGYITHEIQAIADLAASRGIFLVEDCAQSLGAKRDGRSCGVFGDFAAFSFHGQKNITTMGEGGVLRVKDPALAKLVPGLRHNGHVPFRDQSRYWVPAMTNVDEDIPGVWPHNFSMSEVQAALGSALLKRVDALCQDRRVRAQQFMDAMRDYPELRFQVIREGAAHNHHLLVARYGGGKTSATSHDLIAMLGEDYGIKTIVQYYPLYRYDLFKKMGFGAAECPQTDDLFDNMISFPFHHWMSQSDFQYMIDSTSAALRRLREKS